MTSRLLLTGLLLAARPAAAAEPAASSSVSPAPAAPSAVAPAAMNSDPAVAKVNGKTILRSEVAREMASLGPQAQGIPTQYVYQQVLERMIATRLVADKGYDNKLQNTADAKERMKRAEEQIVADIYMGQAVKPMVTEDKIKARYEELSKKYKPEDEVRARHILVASEQEAKDVITQLKGGADFAKVASEKSKDTGSMKEGGDLGYFPKSAMVKPFAEAAFGMKVGELSEKAVKTDFGWHVIKVEDRRPSAPPPLDAVRPQLQAQIAGEMVGQVVKDLEAKAKIERYNLDGTPLTTAQKGKDSPMGKPQ